MSISIEYSKGLAYRLSYDKTHYIVSGIGTCTDAEVVIPSEYNGKPVKEIGDYAFEDCENLMSITIPANVKRIRWYAFSGCINLAKITFASGSQCENIYDWTFYYCKSLTSITIPAAVKSVGRNAFSNCFNLITVTFEEDSQCENIDEYAFSYCDNLTSIMIPASVENIGKHAFNDCFALMRSNTKIAYKATNANMWCRNKHYALGEIYKESNILICNRGFHSCRSPLEVFNYYSGEIGEDILLWEVEVGGKIIEDPNSTKICSEEIRFIRPISISEMADIASGRVKNE